MPDPFYKIDIRLRQQSVTFVESAIAIVRENIEAGVLKGEIMLAGRGFRYCATPDPDGNYADRNIVIVEQ